MTKNTSPGESSRRTFLKGTLAGGLALGAGANVALAQDGDDDQVDTKRFEALVFPGSFHPGARFEVTSDVLNYTPVVPEGARTFGEHNSRVIKYLNTDERALFFPANAAEVRKGGVYEFSQSIRPVNQPSTPVWEVTFGPVSRAETTTAGRTTTATETRTTETRTTETGNEQTTDGGG
ncbi:MULTISPECIES: twin-arginine translocation signal domain-containing protein [Halorussus]|uniref:twin-arginine translocation signal domain-containing protein n=1 Tax=Halorussus TaxID=1070314 RepID=UPI00209D6909|nr:twin-arginine translocation signal domain-containing protein [Halorussus vallis]USZ74320.1 twin-arginine translocation signal domain-containing protein [Halorussus vallis]